MRAGARQNREKTGEETMFKYKEYIAVARAVTQIAIGLVATVILMSLLACGTIGVLVGMYIF